MEFSTEQGKNGKINIYTDGEFRFAVSAFTRYSFPFSDGDEITEEQLAEIKAASDRAKAYESALRHLTARAHGEKELYQKLRMKYGPEAARQAVDRCRQAGLTDDASFAADLAEELSSRKGYAPERIKAELIYRGIDKGIAENAAEALDIDRDSGIIKLLEKMKITDDSPDKDKARAVRRLLNAGYKIGEIRRHLSSETEQF